MTREREKKKTQDNIFGPDDAMTPGQTTCAEEDSVTGSEAPGQLGPLRGIVSNEM